MSTIMLEKLEADIPEEPVDIPEEILEPDQPEESLDQEVVREPTQAPTETPASAPKKRGRPPKAKAEAPPQAPKVKAAPKPKATRKPNAPVQESSDSSDVDETLRMSIIMLQNRIWKRPFTNSWSIGNKQNLRDVVIYGACWRKCKRAILLITK